MRFSSFSPAPCLYSLAPCLYWFLTLHVPSRWGRSWERDCYMYTLQDASLILVDQSEMKILCSDQKWFEWSYFTRGSLKLYASSSKNRVSSLKFSFFADLFRRLMNFSYRFRLHLRHLRLKLLNQERMAVGSSDRSIGGIGFQLRTLDLVGAQNFVWWCGHRHNQSRRNFNFTSS